MALKSNQILFTGSVGGGSSGTSYGNSFIIDRIQSGDINPNITNETITEVGNPKPVGIIRDAPAALTTTIESYDVTAKLEAILLNLDPQDSTSLTPGMALDFGNQVPFSLLCPIRQGINLSAVYGGVIMPHMSLSEVSYRFGLKQDAQQTYTLNGDSMFYGPAGTVPCEMISAGDGTLGQVFTLPYAPVAYTDPASGNTMFVLNVTVYPADSSTPYRLLNGPSFDYQDHGQAGNGYGGAITTFTLNSNVSIPTGWMVKAQYFTLNSADALSIPQADNAADGITVKPAAIRAWNIDVYYATTVTTPVWHRLSNVQSVDATWQATGFEANDEFGSPLSVSYDYVTSAVSGTITTRPDSVKIMVGQLSELLNVDSSRVIGMLSGLPLSILMVLKCPNGVAGVAPGTILKTLYVPDAIFDPPQLTSRTAQKIDLPFKFYSNTGTLITYNGGTGDLVTGGTIGSSG